MENRLETEWEAYKFDEYIEESLRIIGNNYIDPLEFRKRADINRWRSLIKISKPEEKITALLAAIENDILCATKDAIPILAKDIINKFYLNGEKTVTLALLLIIQQAPIYNNMKILDILNDIDTKINTASQGSP